MATDISTDILVDIMMISADVSIDEESVIWPIGRESIDVLPAWQPIYRPIYSWT